MTAPVPATPNDLFAALDRLGIRTRTVEHEAVFTVAESDSLLDRMEGGHTKNLFLKDAKGRLLLLVAEAHSTIDLKSLHRLIGCARLSFGKPDLLMATLGVTPGSVTAFSVINDRDRNVGVIIDKALMRHDFINCHPLTNTATTSIARHDLISFLTATGHPPDILDLTPPCAPGL